MPQRCPQPACRRTAAGTGLQRRGQPQGRHERLARRRPPLGARPMTLPTEEQVLEALKVVKDPEIPVNVVDLGLIYGVDVMEDGKVDITMTLTSVGCPVQDLIRADAEMAVGRLDGVNDVNVEFVWTPPWGPDKMTEDGKRQMRMFGFNV
ncbi:metal-sulfur cluster assembly factor [Deinococcus wulumuqiensis]|uniref:Metal-sulfur cluster assembly factor n=2 Tax=Deinococcus wulumuqiensis TaxID=980427 RepID=A0A345IDY2_9DEIO|nr:metal-sulfur cluster assembly factor [Deinococcus wulumuqiensis]